MLGRPTTYDPKYCDLIVEYFENAANSPVRELAPVTTDTIGGKTGDTQKTEVRRICAELPTLEGFGQSIGVSRKCLGEWAKAHAEFSEAHARAKDIQYRVLVDRGLTRQYDPSAFMFVAKNVTWMADKTLQEITGAEGGPLKVIIHDSERE